MSREKTLEFFHNLPESKAEQFNKACELYRACPGKNAGTERQLNTSGHTPHTLSVVLYELQKAYAITDLEKIPPVVNEAAEPYTIEMFAEAIKASPDKMVLQRLKIDKDFPEIFVSPSGRAKEQFEEIDLAARKFINYIIEQNPESKDLVKSDVRKELFELLKDELEVSEFPEELEQFYQEKIKDKEDHRLNMLGQGLEPTTSAPAQTPEAPKFQDEYSFLKDPDCPAELKILATDKIITYNAYKVAHDKIQKAQAGELVLTPADELALASEAATSFAASEAIKAELDHYGEHKTLLGKHPLFFKLAIEREVDEMTKEQCMKFITSTKTFVSRKTAAINEAQSEDKKAELQRDLDQRQAKLALVKTKLGITD